MNNNPLFETFNGSLRVAVIGVLAILALFLLAETIDAAGNFGRPSVAATDTITVNGDGQATLPPDVAHISFTVQNTAATVADAQAATTKQANAAIAYVKGQKVADKDVKTLSYDISPQYSYSTGVCPPVAPTPGGITSTVVCPGYGSQKITGYQVSETVQVTMRDLTAVGAMLSGLGQLNVQNLNGPDFALDDPTAGSDAARADAITKAKAQATLLASQLGVHLGKIVNFSDSSGGVAYPVMYKAMDASVGTSAATPPSIPAGENTYNDSVSITYEIR
jgi:uncharacterized protein YggE